MIELDLYVHVPVFDDTAIFILVCLGIQYIVNNKLKFAFLSKRFSNDRRIIELNSL